MLHSPSHLLNPATMPTKTSTPFQTSTLPRLKADATDIQRTELLQILSILSLAYHRNKNQHRRSRWWKELSLLRRNLRRLLDTDSSSAGGKNAAPGHAVGRRRGAGKRSEEEVEKEMGERLRYLKERLIPRCWIAFSGVVGDNQYAALGLMLVGTLGRLGRVVGWEGEGEGEGEVVDVKVDVSQVQEMGRQEGEDMHAGEEDLGVPLLREEIMQTEEAQIKEDEKKHMRSESEAVSAETEKLPAKKKRKKKHRDAIDELFSSLI